MGIRKEHNLVAISLFVLGNFLCLPDGLMIIFIGRHVQYTPITAMRQGIAVTFITYFNHVCVFRYLGWYWHSSMVLESIYLHALLSTNTRKNLVLI